MKKQIAAVTAALLTMVLSAFLAFANPTPKPENQPEMQSALEHLREAKKALESATHDKGGHRAKAIQHVDAAMREVQAGIQYDNTHNGPKENKH